MTGAARGRDQSSTDWWRPRVAPVAARRFPHGRLSWQDGLIPVPAPTDRPVRGAQDVEDDPDDEQDDAERVEDADAQHHAEDEQDETQDDHAGCFLWGDSIL